MEFSSPYGAVFSSSKKERFVLWRKWDHTKPSVLFIGLNPSVAGEKTNDPTTKRIIAHAQRLDFGGCFLMNCFTHIATNPKNLVPSGHWKENVKWFEKVAPHCTQVVFAWGKHSLVKELRRDVFFKKRFPNAQCLGLNLDGSPKHPLYLPYSGGLKPLKAQRLNSL